MENFVLHINSDWVGRLYRFNDNIISWVHNSTSLEWIEKRISEMDANTAIRCGWPVGTNYVMLSVE